MRYVLCMQISEKWRRIRDGLKKPSKYQEDCQLPKPILIDTGEIFKPYAWAVRPLSLFLSVINLLYFLIFLITQLSNL